MGTDFKEDLKWADVFYYDEDSPTCLRWNTEVRCGKDGRILKCSIGDIAGSSSGAGLHYEVTYRQKAYWCHRVVWELHSEVIPSNLSIDHIDGNGKNNTIENLRLVKHAVNMRNRKSNVNNTSGVTGVCVRVDHKSGTMYWKAAVVGLDGRHKSKCFRISAYGSDEAKHLAIEWRKEQLKELNTLGAGYSARHGRRLNDDSGV